MNTKVTCHIGAQNRPIGVAAGEFIIEKLNGTGNVIEIEGTVGASATTDRHEGFRDALREAPRIRVVADQFRFSLAMEGADMCWLCLERSRM